MSLRVKILTAIVLAVVTAGSLYLRTLGRRIFERPQQSEEAVRTQLSEAALQPGGAESGQTATLYFPSHAEGKLVAESRPMVWATTDTDRIRQVLLALIEGSRPGKIHVFPPATKIRAVFLASDGTAYLDFSREGLASIPPGIEDESLAVYSIVASLTGNVPAAKAVKFLIEGQEVETLNGHADLSGVFVPDLSKMTLSQ